MCCLLDFYLTRVENTHIVDVSLLFHLTCLCCVYVLWMIPASSVNELPHHAGECMYTSWGALCLCVIVIWLGSERRSLSNTL